MTGLLSMAYEANREPRACSVLWPDDFVRNLDEAQCEALLYAALRRLGIEREDYEAHINLGSKKLVEDVRRDEIRRRIWQIERDIIAWFGPEVQALIEREPKSTRTEKEYAADQRRFSAFCDNLGVPVLPPNAGVIAAFILEEHGIGVPYPTLQKRLSAIAKMYADAGHLMPRQDRLVKVVLQHVRKTDRKEEKK